MEGSLTSQQSRLNTNEKVLSPSIPPTQLQQPTGSVPSIFLGPANSHNHGVPPTENCSSSNQTTQTAAWSSGAEVQRVRSPPILGTTSDPYKMKTCASTQCGNSGAYEGLASGMSMSGGGCQPSLQSRSMYPSYMQQQQIAMPLRSLHQPQHHHGVGPGQCNPHHAPQSGTTTAISMAPHLDRMMHGGSSAVAVAAAQQMRSMAMSHYPSTSTGYPPQPHPSSGPVASSYYSQTVNTSAGNGPFMDYSHSQHHHHPSGQGISAAAAAAVQYAHQQQRMVSSAAAATLNPYRHLSVHHQQKLINSSQAAASAAAYQSAYQQHQYNQYLHHHHHHHSMVTSHAPHTAAGMVHQRLLGIPLTNLQQQQQQQQQHQQQQQAYTNRAGQPLPHIYQHPHNHIYSTACQPPALMSTYTGPTQHVQQQPMSQQHLSNSVVGSGIMSACSNSSAAVSLLDVNNNKTIDTSCFEIPGTKVINKKAGSVEAPIISITQKSHHSCSTKLSSIKVRVTSPDKPVRIKTTKSVTKLRDRPPRLVVSQKKKSVGNISGSSSSRKLKSLKALSAAVSSGVATAEVVDNLYKRLPNSVVEAEGNGDVKRVRKLVKSGRVAAPVKLISDDHPTAGDDSASAALESNEKKFNPIHVADIEPAPELNRLKEDEGSPNYSNYSLPEQISNGDEYVPTSEEMRRYLERLNTCNNLHIPLFYAYSVFHGKLSKTKVVHPTSGNSNNTTTGLSEGTFTTTTTSIAFSTATAIPYMYPSYHHHHHHHYLHQLQAANISASICSNNSSFDSISNFNNNYNNCHTSVISAADLEWNNFQNDMAVLEAYFPLVSTMDQSERAEKLDTIYTYEGQLKLMNSRAPPATPATCVPVVGGDPISPPCTCVPDTTTCSCCYYPGIMMSTMGTPQQCTGMSDPGTCRNAGFVDESSPPQFGLEPGFHSQAAYMSTPLSSRRGYVGVAPGYDTGNSYYGKSEGTTNGCTKPRPATRKRSSSYPSRKSGRRSSGGLKSETESFLDELISTANEEKMAKQRNNSADVTAPEIQCQVDFPSLETSAALPYSKRLTKRSKPDEKLSAREDYLASSSTGSEESESGTSGCSSSSQSPHNISSDDNFDGGSETTPVNSGRGVANDYSAASKSGHHTIILPSTCGHFDPSAETCFTRPEHLWEDFRGDEIVTMQTDPFGSSCIPVTNFTPVISHCTCRRPDAVCPTRPPPGFEHLSRPAFPIELYDPSLLGTLIGGQLPHEVLASLESASSKKQFEEMEELLQSLTCCEKHAVDKMLHSRRSSLSSSVDTEEEEEEDPDEDDWDTLEKAIKTVLSDWTEELNFRKRMQGILFTLNLQDVFGGCCKRFIPFEQAVVEPEHTNRVFASSLASVNPFTPTTNDGLATIFHHTGVNK